MDERTKARVVDLNASVSNLLNFCDAVTCPKVEMSHRPWAENLEASACRKVPASPR